MKLYLYSPFQITVVTAGRAVVNIILIINSKTFNIGRQYRIAGFVFEF